MHKISIRFVNDKEVCAVWGGATNGWLFSVMGVVGVLANTIVYGEMLCVKCVSTGSSVT